MTRAAAARRTLVGALAAALVLGALGFGVRAATIVVAGHDHPATVSGHEANLAPASSRPERTTRVVLFGVVFAAAVVGSLALRRRASEVASVRSHVRDLTGPPRRGPPLVFTVTS